MKVTCRGGLAEKVAVFSNRGDWVPKIKAIAGWIVSPLGNGCTVLGMATGYGIADATRMSRLCLNCVQLSLEPFVS